MKKNADGTETFCKGLLETSQEEFDNSKCRTIVLIDEFDKFFTKTTSAGFINTLKGILNNCSEKHHLTFFLTTNNLQKIPYELINSHRIGLNVNLDPPNKENAVQVIEFYFDGVDTKDLDYERITDELFSFAPTELYSNSHLEQICKIAIEQIKPINEPLDTQMFLQAIDEYNKQSDNHDLLRITEKYLSQYEEDKELV